MFIGRRGMPMRGACGTVSRSEGTRHLCTTESTAVRRIMESREFRQTPRRFNWHNQQDATHSGRAVNTAS